MTEILCRCGNTIDPAIDLLICPSCRSAWIRRRDRIADDLRDHPARRIAQAMIRSRGLGLAATLTIEEWRIVYKRFNGRCSYCQSNRAEIIDHVMPTSRGGGTTLENVRPACEPCNLSKGNKTPEEWILLRGSVPRS